MAKASYNSIAEAIYLTLKEKSPAEQGEMFPRITEFLVRKRLLSKKEEIFSRLERIIDREEERVTAKVSSGFPIEPPLREKLTRVLKERYSAKGVSLKERIDEKLLGGWKIEVGDEVIDLSMRNKVIKLQEHLTKSA